MVTIAAVQMDVVLGDIAGNTSRIIDKLRETSAQGALLTVFPECSATGYCLDSLAAGRELGEAVPGRTSERIVAACRDTRSFCVYGMLELDGPDLFNTAVLAGPQGVVATYRKVHLPYLGIDRYTSYGNRPFQVHTIGDLRVGMLICYDVGFPEATRCLALQGADLVVLPTNWPPGAECMADMCIASRAMENSIYFAAVNRVGTEQGYRFIGRSSICGPSGEMLGKASDAGCEILYAQINPGRARNKRIVRVPDKHLIDRLADRRPEMYAALVAPHQLRTPRQDFTGT